MTGELLSPYFPDISYKNMTLFRFSGVFCLALLLACLPAVGQIQVSGQITSNTTSCTTFVLPFRVADAGWIIRATRCRTVSLFPEGAETLGGPPT
jgi:hypothetical protein